MKKTLLFFFPFALLLLSKNYAQNLDEVEAFDTGVVEGIIVDSATNDPLPYVNIFVLRNNIGTVSNEKGSFLLNSETLKKTDTVRFQFIGYRDKKLSIQELSNLSKISLEVDVIAIEEVFVLNTTIKAEDVVKEILKHKEKNYKKELRKEQLFLRRRFIDDLEELEMECEKSNIEDLDENALKTFQKNIPKKTVSYDDFLGYVYTDYDKEDKIVKIDPIKKVKLKSKDIAELKQFELIFERLMNETTEKQYWKVKSGIFGKKLEKLNEDTTDSIDGKIDEKNSVAARNLRRVKGNVKKLSKYASFEDKDLWDFLYKTNRYDYSFEGGTTINGEDVYVIDFVPKKRGLYEGRLYVAIESFALIRADYQFAKGKTGEDFSLLGFSQANTYFKGSIYFEKQNDTYVLKYFSHKNIESFGLERKFSLQKKKNRFVFDKKLKEIKIDLKLQAKTEVSIEYLVLNSKKISKKEFDSFEEACGMEVISVDQFDENLWKGYSIIEPTKQMKEYKKVK